jgi:hypothetical protein
MIEMNSSPPRAGPRSIAVSIEIGSLAGTPAGPELGTAGQ